MGTIIDARCSRCGAPGKDLFVGQGRLSPWPFESRLYACSDPECDRLTVARMLEPLRSLDRVARGETPPPSEAFQMPANSQELAAMLVRARRWPKCDCGAQLGGRAQRGEQNLPCPRCGRPLDVAEVGLFD